MKKLVSIKGVIDNIRQSVNTPSPPGTTPPGPVKLEQDVLETLSPEQFALEKTVRIRQLFANVLALKQRCYFLRKTSKRKVLPLSWFLARFFAPTSLDTVFACFLFFFEFFYVNNAFGLFNYLVQHLFLNVTCR